MASLEQRNGNYRIVFRLNGEKFSRSLKTKCKVTAQLALAKVKDGLQRIKSGLLEVSPEDDVVTVLLSSGTLKEQPKVSKATLLGNLLDRYLNGIPAGSIEENTIGMLRTHIRHLKRLMGTRLNTLAIDLLKLQDYINARS